MAGTDTGNPYCFPGFSLHDELALLVESGLTPLAALQAATRNPAIFMNASNRYGSVSKGKIADLVLLDADPLQDIRNTARIAAVFVSGRSFDRAELNEILQNAENRAKQSLESAAPAETLANPFVGTWKFIPERSHFDGNAPKDINLRFQINY